MGLASLVIIFRTMPLIIGLLSSWLPSICFVPLIGARERAHTHASGFYLLAAITKLHKPQKFIPSQFWRLQVRNQVQGCAPSESSRGKFFLAYFWLLVT